MTATLPIKPQTLIAEYQAALKANRGDFAAYLKLGDELLAQHNPALYQISLACYLKAMQLRPETPGVYYRLGKVYKNLGKPAQAIATLQKALQLDPGLIRARFSLLDCLFPIIYEQEADIVATRLAYSRQIQVLSDTLDLHDPAAIDEAAQALGAYTFHLPYQGYNDVELQRRYGQVLCRIQSAKYPQWSQPLSPSPLATDEPLRVGILSGYFRQHATWNFPTRGLLEALDRKRFALYGYHVGRVSDATTDFARQAFDHFVEQDFSLKSVGRKILADKLHVLMYPEIGMNPLAIRLAALRLAPIQCAWWGHSTTTGLPTMDYFLSSDLMEPADGASHYTETLIRLPNLGVYYLPQDIEPAALDRATLGLRPEALLYLCAQNLIKYLPQYDDVFPRIARQAGNCQFIFLVNSKSQPVVKLFRQRLATAFSRQGLNSDDYLVFLPYLENTAYAGLYRLADVFLDTIGWSGCNTTLDAVAGGLPVVTLPGPLMRGRQTLAILTMMAVTATVAESVDDYVQIAARLGTEAPWRRQIHAQMAANKHKLYRDRAPIERLEAFLETAVAEARHPRYSSSP